MMLLGPLDNAAVRSKVAQYLLLNQEIADRKSMQGNLKAELEPYLQEAETNARGSHVIPFDEPLKVGDKQYASLQRVKKTSKVLNEERTLEFLRKDQAFECAIVTVEHVDQDVLWDLFVNGGLTREELDSFFDTNITWAFSPTKV